MEVTLTLSNNNNLLNNISQIPLPPQVPGQRPTIISDVLLDYPPQYVPQEGKKSLSATTLQERERTPCPHTLPERVRTLCFLSPQEGERTPCFHTPQEGVKTPCSHTPQEGVKTPCSHTPQEGIKTPGVQSHIVFIQDQVQNENNLKMGSRLKFFLPVWKNLGAHHSIQSLIAEGYKLPFRERPKLSRTPCITSGFADLNKQSALSTAIQDLIRKGAIDIVQKPDSLGFYSRLFLVPKPGNRWRPVIDLSCLNKFLAISKFKMETPESIRASLRKNEWVTSIDLTDAYLHIPIQPHSQKYLRFHHKGVSYQFTSLPVRPSYSPLDLHQCSERGQTFSLATGNTHSPIPGRLAGSRPLQGGVPQTDPKVVEPNPGFGVYSELQEVRTGTFPEVRFSGLPLFARFGACQAHARQVDEASGYVPSPLVEVCYQCKDSYVHHWITCINGEDSQTGQDAYETFSMASQDSLEISDASGYSNPLESEDDTTRGMVVRPQKRATRRVSPPKGTRKTDLYRRLKRRLGRTLRSRFNRRGLVSHRKSSPHQLFGIKGSSPGTTVLQDHLQEQSGSHCLRQHLRSVLHKQTGWHKIRRTLRSNVENSDMVQSQQRHTQSKTHTRIPQCNSGRPLKEEPDPKHRVVPISTSFQTNIKDMGKSRSGPFCNQTQHKAPLVRLSDPGSPSLGSGRPEHSMGESGCIRFSPNRPPAQGYTETPVTNVQASSDRPRLAIKTMVLGPSGNVTGRTSTVTSNANLTQTTNEQHFPLQPGLPQPPRLVSRSTALQQRGFTAEVARLYRNSSHKCAGFS